MRGCEDLLTARRSHPVIGRSKRPMGGALFWMRSTICPGSTNHSTLSGELAYIFILREKEIEIAMARKVADVLWENAC